MKFGLRRHSRHGAGDWIPASAGMTVRVCGVLFSEESLMSVVTDTTNHENGGRAIRESPLREIGRGYFQRNRLKELA